MLILALESSTTSAKAMLYSTETGIIRLVTEKFPSDINDIETQDAEGVFHYTIKVGKEICEGHNIDCIVLSGIWHSLMLCDKAMTPVTRVMGWADTKASEVCSRIRLNEKEASEFYNKTGCPVNAMYPAFKLLYLKEQGYRLQDYYIFGQGSYIMYRLTGRRVVTECMASGSGLMNIHEMKYDSSILQDIGITENQLCEIVAYNDAYPLSEEGAKQLGLKAGIPVIPPCSDGALNQVGAGALDDGVMTFSVGTSAAIRLSTMKPILPRDASTWCYRSPKSWLNGAATSGACNCTDWFMDNFLQTSYDKIENNSRLSIDAPIFLPFLFGERSPGWQGQRRGAFVGIQPWHTKEDFYRAIQEGILFNVFQSYKVLGNLHGTPNKIILSGGIINSEFWTQMCVDIFGIEMEVAAQEQSSLMGAAILALEKLGVLSDAKAFSFKKGRIVKPNPELTKVYAEKFELYQSWYDKML